MKQKIFFIFFVFLIVSLSSCATIQPIRDEGEKIEPPKAGQITETKAPEIKLPEFVPVKEDISPVDTRLVSISARNTPLKDVLYSIAEAVNLNLVMDKGVNPELPVTMTLYNIPAREALNVITNSSDYFYSIKDNMLFVRSTDTRIFEIGQPAVVHEYSTDLGGDILGGVTQEAQTSIKGTVSMKSTSDKVSFQFWDALENSLKTLLSLTGEAKETSQSKFTINRMTGTIMVTASKKDIENVENYINNLKKVLNREVLIEARIVEVRLSDTLKYGIDWTFLDNLHGIGDIQIGMANFRDVVDPRGALFQIGITGSSFTSILNALQTQGDVKILSNPRVNILNGQVALLTVGRNQSYISKVETTQSTAAGATPITTFTVETKSILSGIIFGLVPYIDGKGEIRLTITPIVSNLIGLEARAFGAGTTNAVEIQLPTVDLREMSTTVKVSEGELVIIGGLIDKREELNESKVPFLGDIPILGNLFKSVNKSFEKTELVIMLRPTILKKSERAE